MMESNLSKGNLARLRPKTSQARGGGFNYVLNKQSVDQLTFNSAQLL